MGDFNCQIYPPIGVKVILKYFKESSGLSNRQECNDYCVFYYPFVKLSDIRVLIQLPKNKIQVELMQTEVIIFFLYNQHFAICIERTIVWIKKTDQTNDMFPYKFYLPTFCLRNFLASLFRFFFALLKWNCKKIDLKLIIRFLLFLSGLSV
jgi:hypothetical protein